MSVNISSDVRTSRHDEMPGYLLRSNAYVIDTE